MLFQQQLLFVAFATKSANEVYEHRLSDMIVVGCKHHP
jgi:hypothetical protein